MPAVYGIEPPACAERGVLLLETSALLCHSSGRSASEAPESGGGSNRAVAYTSAPANTSPASVRCSDRSACVVVWLRSTGAVVLRYPDSEHRYERRIQGGSMLFAGDVAREVRFSDIPRAVDSDILDRSMAEGVKVYSGDRYNYVSIRGSDRHAHTWTVSDATFMTATGRLLYS